MSLYNWKDNESGINFFKKELKKKKTCKKDELGEREEIYEDCENIATCNWSCICDLNMNFYFFFCKSSEKRNEEMEMKK